MTKEELAQMSPLTLAYMGDTVYESYVRRALIERYPGHTTHELHQRATRLVRASAQAHTAMALMDELTEAERAVFRRGRNMHNATVPKNADVGEYRMATGFEAVLGRLYLADEQQRLQELLDLACEKTWEGLMK